MFDDQIVLENDRDRRTLDWLVGQVGESAIAEALTRLAGNRRPYLSNVAKVLGIALPANLERTPSAEARERLASVRAMLAQKAAKC